MPAGKGHIHTAKWHRCWEKVQAQGHDSSSAAAICTAAIGDESFLAAEEEADAMRMVDLRINAGELRVVNEEGIDWTVVPVTALVEGVIRAINSPYPEFVSAEKFAAAPKGWDGRPIFLNHPMENGHPVSGNSPEILKTAIGRVHNTRVVGKRLLMEAWLHPEKAKSVIARVSNGKPVEISTGAHVLLREGNGNHHGKSWNGSWDVIYPDHLAILPEGARGACSFDMGCGIRASMMHELDGPDSEVLRIASEVDFSCIDTWRIAVGKRHSAHDQGMLQEIHDHTVRLGAACDNRSDAQKAIDGMTTDRAMRAACSCQDGKESDMTKAERITALLGHPHNPVKDKTLLEAASDATLKDLEDSAAKSKKKDEDDAAEVEKLKTAAKTKDEEIKKKDEELKAAQAASSKSKTEAEWLAEAPQDLRTLVEESKAEKAAKKAELITQLKAAQKIYDEAELNAMDVKQLTKIAALAKVPEPVDYSGRGGPRAAEDATDYFKQPPPDGYALALKKEKVN